MFTARGPFDRRYEIVFKRFMLDQTKEPKNAPYLINQMLETCAARSSGRPQFAEFDLSVHTLAEKGEPITAEVLMKICHEQYERYYGPVFCHRFSAGCEGMVSRTITAAIMFTVTRTVTAPRSASPGTS